MHKNVYKIVYRATVYNSEQCKSNIFVQKLNYDTFI